MPRRLQLLSLAVLGLLVALLIVAADAHGSGSTFHAGTSTGATPASTVSPYDPDGCC